MTPFFVITLATLCYLALLVVICTWPRKGMKREEPEHERKGKP